jgi:hypothetical protein
VEEYFGQKKTHATAPVQKSHMLTKFGNPERREDEGKGKENWPIQARIDRNNKICFPNSFAGV